MWLIGHILKYIGWGILIAIPIILYLVYTHNVLSGG
jgi:hypothetical protein